MRILIYSRPFAPSIGGQERLAEILATEFTRLGAAVRVLTETPGAAMDAPYALVRRPRLRDWRAALGWADVVLQTGLSLRGLLPLALWPVPLVVSHGGFYGGVTPGERAAGFCKRMLTRRLRNVAVSQAAADDIPGACTVIANPYDAGLFHPRPEVTRDRELLFVGRLVDGKGCHLLIEALRRLRDWGLRPCLSVVGGGVEEERLQAQVAAAQLQQQVRFLGQQPPEAVARLMNAHDVLVVPSCWREAFGIVALEGVASGCALVASRSEGLVEAVGPCGLLFDNGDVDGLARALQQLLGDPALQKRLRAAAAEHLKAFQPASVARRYLEILSAAVT